jgi:hypothetical protein
MEQQHMPEQIVALYDELASAEAAMEALEAAGVPYPDIRMGAHNIDDPDWPDLGDVVLPDTFWSLKVVVDQRGVYHAEDLLREHQPLAIGRMPAPNQGRSDTDLGALAWRHYVFESPHATDQVGEFAGTTGNTGLSTSGVFADGALAEGNPPVRGRRGSHGRPASERQRPTTDDRQPATAVDSARPDTKLQE